MVKKDIKVGGVELKWDLEAGDVFFEGGDVVFFFGFQRWKPFLIQ